MISSQKHLDIILDETLSFEEHLKTVPAKNNKTLYLLRKLQNPLPTACFNCIMQIDYKTLS